MPYSEQMADLMRADLGLLPGLAEKKMFGGLCFLLHGHMVCGVHKDGTMFRPGKPREAKALSLGADPLSFTGRPMGGVVELNEPGFADDALCSPLHTRLIELSLTNAASLPPKAKT